MHTRCVGSKLVNMMEAIQRFRYFSSTSKQIATLERHPQKVTPLSLHTSIASNSSDCQRPSPNVFEISEGFDTLLHRLTLHATQGSTSPRKYHLLSLQHVHKSILDPLGKDKAYWLPVLDPQQSIDLVVPSTLHAPITDPRPLQRVIDQGAPPVAKKAINMINIRHKKMKKHQLRKLRKRMRFLNRRLNAIKAKRREQKLVDYEKEKAKAAQGFDAGHSVDEHLARAREAGWSIDVLAERAAARRAGMGGGVGGSEHK